MAGLPRGEIERLIDTCEKLLEERQAIIAALGGMRVPFGDVRGPAKRAAGNRPRLRRLGETRLVAR